MKGLDCFVCTLPCSAEAMESQQSDGLHSHYIPIDWCAWSGFRVAKESRNNANLLSKDRSRDA